MGRVLGSRPVTACATRLWVPFDTNGNRGNYRVRRVSRNGTFRLSFQLPSDVGQVQSVRLVGIPRQTQADAVIEVYGHSAPVGAHFATSGGSITGVAYALTASQIFEVEATSIFAASAAGDICGLMVDNDGLAGNVEYLGASVEYTL